MEIYHKVWLEAHPHRTEEWLADKLKDGFDIHHTDGDHDNNDPKNLMLVEAQDHMLVHTGVMFLPKRLIKLKEGWTNAEDVARIKEERQAAKAAARADCLDRKSVIGEIAYKLRVNGFSWEKIEKMLMHGREWFSGNWRDKEHGWTAMSCARAYADKYDAVWPIMSHDDWMALMTG